MDMEGFVVVRAMEVEVLCCLVVAECSSSLLVRFGPMGGSLLKRATHGPEDNNSDTSSQLPIQLCLQLLAKFYSPLFTKASLFILLKPSICAQKWLYRQGIFASMAGAIESAGNTRNSHDENYDATTSSFSLFKYLKPTSRIPLLIRMLPFILLSINKSIMMHCRFSSAANPFK